ncbi:hypothetical protein, partial [Halobacillus sp. BBL2006]|uniref:hypothetical protein n=1 Tax=Halobacillus sp. BBL2006 TaxID=1543706 RepID=UPI001E2A23B6
RFCTISQHRCADAYRVSFISYSSVELRSLDPRVAAVEKAHSTCTACLMLVVSFEASPHPNRPVNTPLFKALPPLS